MADKEYKKFQYYQDNQWGDKVFDDIGIFTGTKMCFTNPMTFHTINQNLLVPINTNVNSISPLDSYNFTGTTRIEDTIVEITDDEINNMILTNSIVSLQNNNIYTKTSVLKRGFSSQPL